MIRVVKPEILDSLPQGHPDALHNRRDIRRLNILMGNFRWFARILKKVLRPQDRLLDLGAGGGDLGKHLERSTLRDPSIPLTGLDLWSRPSFWPERWDWLQEDIRSFNGYDRYPVILANLILHQFEDSLLSEIGSRINRHARVILASETARRKRHLHQLKLAKLLGTHPVTDHDAKVSIEAGFVGEELPLLLGLDASVWTWTCKTCLLGQYRMIAVRQF